MKLMTVNRYCKNNLLCFVKQGLNSTRFLCRILAIGLPAGYVYFVMVFFKL